MNHFYVVETDKDAFVRRLCDHVKVHNDRLKLVTQEIINLERGKSIKLTNDEKSQLFHK